MNTEIRAGQTVLLACILALGIGAWGCAQGSSPAAGPPGTAVQEKRSLERPAMESRPIAYTGLRRRLMREYARIHYGREMETIIPQAVVVHWTASNSRDGVFRYFYNEENP